MPDIRTPTTGTFFTGAVIRDVPIWDGAEWQAGAITPVSAVRPAGAADGVSILDLSLVPPRPIWALAAALPTGWIDGSGAVV